MDKSASSVKESLAERVKAARLPTPANRRRIRQRAGLSLRQMAGQLGVTPMSVLRWERGEATPKLDHATAYRQLLEDLEEACAS
jgi:DNA-binding XRE family transcriptional regulator